MSVELGLGQKVSWKNINSDRYLLLSFKDLGDEDSLEVVSNAMELLSSVPDDTVKIVTDLTNVNFDIDTHLSLNTFSKECQSKIKKSAIIGMSKPMYPFFKIYKMFTNSKAELFESMEEAESYLVSN